MTDRIYAIIRQPDPCILRGELKLVANPSFDGDWWKTVYPGSKPTQVHAHRVDGAACGENGIFFSEELAGASGMSFMLFPEDRHTKEDVLAAKQWLRSRRDVVRILVFKSQGS